MSRNSLLPTWKEFLIALEKRFGPSEYEDSLCRLCKLLPGSLCDYQLHFEHLVNKIYEIPEHALVRCFISGLRPDLRKETLVSCPQSLVQAMGLVRSFDDESLDRNSIIDQGWTQANQISLLGILVSGSSTFVANSFFYSSAT